MSDELRREAADIARALRRRVERERALGTGELLANEVARVRKARGTHTEPVAGFTAPVAAASNAPAAQAAPASPTGSRVATPPSAPARPAPPRAVKMPSEPVIESAPALPAFLAGLPEHKPSAAAANKPKDPLDDIVLPPFTAELYPSALKGGREGLHDRALPVLDAVAAEANACTQCNLCQTRTKAVPGIGSARSGIVFVGEAPGADEDERGEPFVGRAGELLTKMIAAMDEKQLIPGVKLDREHVFIVNVLKCRPPENRNPMPAEIEACSPYLLRQLEALQPRVICCLGKFAADLLLQLKNTTIASMRGRTYRWRGAKLIVTYHPAYCLRSPSAKRPVWEDLQRLAQEYLAD
ncbi:MAG: hypothetical protein RL760_330 [Candidatus Eisenbacteria bacterium]